MPEVGVFVDVVGFGLESQSRVHYIVCVRQEGFQDWAVYRDYQAFQTLEFQIQNLYDGTDALPVIDPSMMRYEAVQISRELLNDWLLQVLSLSEILSTQAVFQFLCVKANIPPSEFEVIFPASIPPTWMMNESNIDDISYQMEDPTDEWKADSKSYGSTFDEKDVQSFNQGNVDILYQETNLDPRFTGKELSSFSILKILGRGSFGKVFLCNFRALDKLFAMKVVSKSSMREKQQVAHTLSERNLLSRVRHPFIVELVMAFQTKYKLFFILEYCPGGELFHQLCKEGRFPEPRAKFYAAQVILALEHIHSYRFIYRDLKPENVLLDRWGNVKLTDFGLSKSGVMSAFEGATTFCGTPEYIAPEVLMGNEYGKAVDRWSLGALYYEMVAGAPPFYSKNKSTMFQRIMLVDLIFPRFMSDVLN